MKLIDTLLRYSERKTAMPSSGRFNPNLVSGLPSKAREAVNAAFEAMSTWRSEVAETNEKNCNRVIEKMAAAAEAMGWPEQVIETTRGQMQRLTEMQTETMDRLMDAWEAQLKSPNPMTASTSAMMAKLASPPNFGSAGTWPGADFFQGAALGPVQFWMQIAQQWQKAWTDAMAFWVKAGKPN